MHAFLTRLFVVLPSRFLFFFFFFLGNSRSSAQSGQTELRANCFAQIASTSINNLTKAKPTKCTIKEQIIGVLLPSHSKSNRQVPQMPNKCNIHVSSLFGGMNIAEKVSSKLSKNTHT